MRNQPRHIAARCRNRLPRSSPIPQPPIGERRRALATAAALGLAAIAKAACAKPGKKPEKQLEKQPGSKTENAKDLGNEEMATMAPPKKEAPEENAQGTLFPLVFLALAATTAIVGALACAMGSLVAWKHYKLSRNARKKMEELKKLVEKKRQSS